MAPKENIEKSYFSIGEVSRMLDLPQSLIRFWEKEFDILKPGKTDKGTRKFSQKDIRHIRLIHHLVKEKGYTLAGAKEKLKREEHPEEHARVVDSLKRTRDFLLSLQKELNKIS